MEPLNALIVAGIIFVVLFTLTIANFARMGRGMLDFNRSFEDTAKSFGAGLTLHILLGGGAALAFLATVGCGIWLVG